MIPSFILIYQVVSLPDCLYYNTLIKCMQAGIPRKDTLNKLCILYTC
nr:MAG TPA: hypothetical protein [Caudoviricetes sp.]